MSEPFKAYVNKACFATNGDEVQISLYIERPLFDEDGKVVMVREEQGLLTMSHEYAGIFANKLEETLQGQIDSLSEDINEVKDNGSK